MNGNGNRDRLAPRLAAILGGAAIVLATLGGLGWRVLEQERALARERRREAVERAAENVARMLHESRRRAGPIRLEWAEGGLTRVSGAELVWWPGAKPGQEAAPEIFAEAERAEFGGRGPALALPMYRKLAASGEEAVRAGALVREARCLLKLGQRGAAMEAYSKLRSCEVAWAGGLPAELLALYALGERQQLDRLLREAKHRLPRAAFELLAEGGVVRRIRHAGRGPTRRGRTLAPGGRARAAGVGRAAGDAGIQRLPKSG